MFENIPPEELSADDENKNSDSSTEEEQSASQDENIDSEETKQEPTDEEQPVANISVEVDYDFIEKLYNTAGIAVPDNPLQEDMNSVLDKINEKLNLNSSLEKSNDKSGDIIDDSAAADDSSRPRSVLVVDDLGIVTMQLASLLKKIDFEVTTSRELFDAIKKYKTKDFGYAVVDLFIPTEREGFILIDEIKKLSLLCRLDTKIIVMSASNKKEHKDKCKNKGANIFIEKNSGWQNKIVDYLTGKITS